MKKIILIMASIYIAIYLGACTSTEETADGEGATAAEASSDSGQSVDGTTEQSLEASLDSAPEMQITDSGSADAGSGGSADAVVGGGDVAASGGDAAIGGESAGTSPSEGGSVLDSQAPVVDAAQDSSAVASSDLAMSAPPPAAPAEDQPPPPSYKKAETTPFKRGGQLLNTVYLARPGDNWKSVSSLIYGSEDKAETLKKANPALSKVSPGAKIYYNSPERTSDDAKLITYYEDKGIQPQIYVAQEGDNLKKVGKKVLGFPQGWKELYATNPVESKDEIPAGTELRYWADVPKAEVASHNKTAELAPPSDAMAQNFPPPPPPAAEMAPPPPPPEPPPPPPPPPAMAQVDNNMAPPPPPTSLEPPPPPPMKPQRELAKEQMPLDNDTMMALGAGAVIILGLVAIMIIRKRRQEKEIASAFQDTHVG